MTTNRVLTCCAVIGFGFVIVVNVMFPKPRETVHPEMLTNLFQRAENGELSSLIIDDRYYEELHAIAEGFAKSLENNKPALSVLDADLDRTTERVWPDGNIPSDFVTRINDIKSRSDAIRSDEANFIEPYREEEDLWDTPDVMKEKRLEVEKLLVALKTWQEYRKDIVKLMEDIRRFYKKPG